MDPVEAAKALVEERFPQCLAAFVAGSIIEGRGTPTSDLDMVIITDDGEAPYRESLKYSGWPVELFVHTLDSYKLYFASDVKRRAPTLARMCTGVILRNLDGIADAVRDEAQALIDMGPEPVAEAELENRRYMLTDLLDDFVGSNNPGETGLIAAKLVEDSMDLFLAVHRRWSGRGKWLARALNAMDPSLTREAVAAVEAFHTTHDKNPLIAFAGNALEAAGGRLWEGYRQAGRRP